jgi:hypothetical protein
LLNNKLLNDKSLTGPAEGEASRGTASIFLGYRVVSTIRDIPECKPPGGQFAKLSIDGKHDLRSKLTFSASA